MSRPLRALSAGFVAALLALASLAFTVGDDPEAKAALGPLQAVTLTAADFHPASDTAGFTNGGYYLESAGVQIARIPFPAETVVLTSLKARVYDNYASDLCIWLYRAVPADATEDDLGGACTSGQSPTRPQTLSISAFTRVGKFHTAYLWAEFGADSFDLRLYGATVFYRVVT
jgi:hypothetical protein